MKKLNNYSIIKFLYLYSGSFTCPNCGSKNARQSTYVEYCPDCGWEEHY